MDNNFSLTEKLYRAVLPTDMFWKDNGKVSSAAFLSRKGGCSVDRGFFRDDNAVVLDMEKRNLKGDIIAVTVLNCREVEAVPIYAPSKNNIYHSEIHGSNEHIPLSPRQRKHLANSAVIVSM
ncbi:MAG: hypothetical protein II917_09635 [Synergistaceae bacterium]|nr:hypothetical protein [Synergistaceae bacterium]